MAQLKSKPKREACPLCPEPVLRIVATETRKTYVHEEGPNDIYYGCTVPLIKGKERQRELPSNT